MRSEEWGVGRFAPAAANVGEKEDRGSRLAKEEADLKKKSTLTFNKNVTSRSARTPLYTQRHAFTYNIKINK